VWVGYDENIPHGLTGATGAVPIWTNYMKAYAATFPPDDFPWPTSVEQVTLNADQLAGYGAPNESGGKNSENHESVTLVFKKGQGPHLPPASPSPHP
jgi:penicillin-binding protein 1B